MDNKSKSEKRIERKVDWQCQSIDKCIKVIMGLLGCDRDAAFEYARKRENNNPLTTPTGRSECVSSEKVEFTPPTMEEVNAYFIQAWYRSNPIMFYNHYSARGWVGVKNWYFAAKNWEIHYYRMKNKYKYTKIYKEER